MRAHIKNSKIRDKDFNDKHLGLSETKIPKIVLSIILSIIVFNS
jgi:hypothetical protein